MGRNDSIILNKNKMKQLFALVFVLISQYNFAQITKETGDFDALKVFDKLSVTLIPAQENKIEIDGYRKEEVEIVTKNGELKIRMPFPKLLSGDQTTIKLYFKQLQTIDASEGSLVSCETELEQTAIDLNAKEGATINVILNVEKATIRSVSGGIINASGVATNQKAIVIAGGTIDAGDLQTEQTDVSVSAGGKATIYATTLVDAKVKAGGTIFIYGKPKQIHQETIAGGKVIEK
jgi:Putative auto-transporter adhesin, head GIN domain